MVTILIRCKVKNDTVIAVACSNHEQGQFGSPIKMSKKPVCGNYQNEYQLEPSYNFTYFS